jgi:Spy/CpxP family protein refolding chaperone
MKNTVESLGRIRAQGVALLVVTFVVGALAGMAFERLRAPQPDLPPGREPGLGMMRPFGPGRLPPMFEELNLTAEQRAEISDIMERSRPRTDELLESMLPRLRAVMDSVRDEIHAVLTPEQAVKLDSLMADMQGQFRGMRRGLRERDQVPPRPRRRGPP